MGGCGAIARWHGAAIARCHVSVLWCGVTFQTRSWYLGFMLRDFLDFRTSAVWFCSEMFCQNVLGFEMVAWTLLPLRAERCGDILIFTMSCNATSLVLWAMRP